MRRAGCVKRASCPTLSFEFQIEIYPSQYIKFNIWDGQGASKPSPNDSLGTLKFSFSDLYLFYFRFYSFRPKPVILIFEFRNYISFGLALRAFKKSSQAICANKIWKLKARKSYFVARCTRKVFNRLAGTLRRALLLPADFFPYHRLCAARRARARFDKAFSFSCLTARFAPL